MYFQLSSTFFGKIFKQFQLSSSIPLVLFYKLILLCAWVLNLPRFYSFLSLYIWMCPNTTSHWFVFMVICYDTCCMVILWWSLNFIFHGYMLWYTLLGMIHITWWHASLQLSSREIEDRITHGENLKGIQCGSAAPIFAR